MRERNMRYDEREKERKNVDFLEERNKRERNMMRESVNGERARVMRKREKSKRGKY